MAKDPITGVINKAPLWQYMDPRHPDDRTPLAKILFRDGVPVDIDKIENDDLLTVFTQLQDPRIPPDPDIRFEILRRMRPMVSPRIGLAVMRAQPFHKGHELMISTMLNTCQYAIIGLGSTESPISKQNPWNSNIRTKMILNVFGGRVKIIQLRDLGTSIKTNDWVNYVLERCRAVGIVDEPTDYFTGSKQDGLWYAGKFYNDVFGAPTDSQHALDGSLKRIHFVDRGKNDIISATEIRGYLELRDDTWKDYVSPVNHELVETHYPEQFRVIS